MRLTLSTNFINDLQYLNVMVTVSFCFLFSESVNDDQNVKGQRSQSTSWLNVDRVNLDLSESSDVDLRGEVIIIVELLVSLCL